MGPRKTVHTTYREVKARVLGHQGLTHPHWGEKGGRGLQRGSQKGPRERERMLTNRGLGAGGEKNSAFSRISRRKDKYTLPEKQKAEQEGKKKHRIKLEPWGDHSHGRGHSNIKVFTDSIKMISQHWKDAGCEQCGFLLYSNVR